MAGGPLFLRPAEEFSVRLSFVDFDGKGALSESKAIGLESKLPRDFVRTHCNGVYEGIKSLCDWVEMQK